MLACSQCAASVRSTSASVMSANPTDAVRIAGAVGYRLQPAGLTDRVRWVVVGLHVHRFDDVVVAEIGEQILDQIVLAQWRIIVGEHLHRHRRGEPRIVLPFPDVMVAVDDRAVVHRCLPLRRRCRAGVLAIHITTERRGRFALSGQLGWRSRGGEAPQTASFDRLRMRFASWHATPSRTHVADGGPHPEPVEGRSPCLRGPHCKVRVELGVDGVTGARNCSAPGGGAALPGFEVDHACNRTRCHRLRHSRLLAVERPAWRTPNWRGACTCRRHRACAGSAGSRKPA